MSEQGSLSFGDTPGKVRRDHPETSRDAAKAVMPRSGTQRRRVYDYIAARDDIGATDEEIQRGLGMGGNTQRPRRVELVEAGLVIDSGRRRTFRGRWMIVWVAAKR